MVHPGFVVDPALPSGCGSPADDFSMSVERETEMECLCGMRPALAFVVVLHLAVLRDAGLVRTHSHAQMWVLLQGW